MNIDLTKILKNCPAGTKLYSPIYGEIYFEEIRSNDRYPISTITKSNYTATFTKEGLHYADEDGECVLFPSKYQRDWSKFTAPWYKKEKFDPRTLAPFDKILVRDCRIENWYAAQFSHIMYDLSEYEYDDYEEKVDFIICAAGATDFSYCIPFNYDTKSLVGTTKEAPKNYRYWED